MRYDFSIYKRRKYPIIWEADYVIYKSRKYPIIWKKEGAVKTDPCPFCNRPHEHTGEGHKNIQCTITSPSKPKIELSDGSIAESKDGYYLLEY